MGALATLARRTFLVGSAAVAGGLAVGYVAYRRDPDNPLAALAQPGRNTLNPYVLIDTQRITLIAPRADVGQGVMSVQAALIAEEMDLAWGAFDVDFGAPSAAYWNGHVLAEGLPVRSVSEASLARTVREVVPDVIGKLAGLQLTGGSSTVADAYVRLRTAGAVARAMLMAAAARQSGTPVAQLKTHEGAVVLPDGRRLPYTALAGLAATLDVPKDVPLKPPSQWRLLGKPMPRLDIVAKSTGTAVYGIDLRLPGMVHATVRMNPRLGGAMLGMDTRGAERAPGVLKIVPLPPHGFGVIANNTWRAFQAAQRVQPQWGPAPYPATSAAMWDALGAAFVDATRERVGRDDGAVTAALAEPGVKTLAAEYRVPHLAHAPLEPSNAVAQLKDGWLDVWAAVQIPRFAAAAAAKAIGLATDRVRLHAQLAGGSFGRRLEDDHVRQAARLAQAHPGVPVKMTWTREEDFTHDFPRPMALARGRGAVKDGKVHAFDLAIATASVTTSQIGRLGLPAAGPDMAMLAGAWDQPLAIPHCRVQAHRAPEMVPISSWRSVGASGHGFFHESLLDELIHAAGADPLAERLRLCTHAPTRAVLQAVGELSGWGTPLPAGRGRGLACVLSFGVPCAQVVEVTMTERGVRIDRLFVVADIGRAIDPGNVAAQMEGGALFGLGHAMNCELTYADGQPQQTNFHAHEGLRLHQAPAVTVRVLESGDPVRGIGEPPVPPAAPALANAIFAATGRRIRELPLSRHIEFAA